jgi:GST-like protein
VDGKYEVIQWLMFQVGGIGPMQGQATAFERYIGEDVPLARTRYKNETRRLYEVLNLRLKDRPYLAENTASLISRIFCWVRAHQVGSDSRRWVGSSASLDRGGLEKTGCRARGMIPPPAGSADKQVRLGANMTTR